MDESTGARNGVDDPGSTGADARATTPLTRRKGFLVGSVTLACALGGAFLGAFAFSAFPGAVPGLGRSTDQLASGSAPVPNDTGALCTSTRNTPTAADTALSCENYGTTSFTSAIARAERLRALADSVGLAGSSGTAATGRSNPAGGAVPAGTRRQSDSAGAAALPGATSRSRATTCVSSPSGTPGLPVSVSVSASAGGGTVSVKAGKNGLSVCGKAPTAPTLPVLSQLPAVPGTSGGTTAKKTHHKKKHKATTSLQGIVNGVTNGLGNLTGGLGGL